MAENCTILFLDFGDKFLRVENTHFLLRLSYLLKEVSKDREQGLLVATPPSLLTLGPRVGENFLTKWLTVEQGLEYRVCIACVPKL